MRIVKQGVNYCHCKLCHTEFFFDKEDIAQPKDNELFQAVLCPRCKCRMFLEFHDKYFTCNRPS